VLITEGTLLGGRVRYSQPAHGFRSGIEPVLLAAAVPARPDERVLEAGTGAGAALLCLAARVPGLGATGVELDPAVARLAAANAAANGFDTIRVIEGPIESVKLDGPFDHAIANPPYHPPDGSASPVTGRDLAKRGSATLLETWVRRLAAPLRDRGTLTLVLPAALVPAALRTLEDARCPCSALFPLWSKACRPAKLVLLRGIRLGRTPMRLLPGLVLHEPGGSFTEAARALLEDAAPLRLDSHAAPGN
jgi:tRNA1(Val) A37 N6-methylase TrmN6